ncbi:hypothetical protein ABW20_dc0105242 [Dactylellina cionopaga]|nr:hypothetical protein ABW20_dc0105242 [Dactylellina cionopaga]
MTTIAPTAQVGGGEGSASQQETPIKIVHQVFKDELLQIHNNQYSNIPFNEFAYEFCGPKYNVILPPPAQDVDLAHPLTSYFISSSHNTYLVDHQLYGDSTVEGYVNTLTRACRCVEIDVWDGDDGEPKVDHGWTLTKGIRFKEVCEAISKYAFSHSDLPLIVSLECHASMEQQEKMVAIMKTTWKDTLMEGELPGWNVAEKGLPPPGLLKKKILVKVKYLPLDAQPGGPSGPAIQSLTSQTQKLSVADDEDSEEDPEAKKAPKVKISAALSALGVYASAMKFANSFSDAVSTRPNHVFSFSEKKFNSLHETHADELFRHNSKYLTRIYPHGLRISSSNLNPQDFWRRGAQLVALNWQKVDKGITFNEAMFAGTGGYVLKPQSHLPNPATPVSVASLEKDLDLKVTILAGQSLPLPKGTDKPKDFQPYVKVIVHTSQTVKQKLKVKHGKGQNYRWDKKNMLHFKAPAVIPELTFVKFKVYDDEFGKDDKAAWACVRLDRLKTGYGYLKLFDMKGKESEGVLLIHVEKTII